MAGQEPDDGKRGGRRRRSNRMMYADELDLVDRVRQLLREGAVAAEIGEVIGYSPSWVYRFAKRHGIAMKPGNRSRDLPSAEAQAILHDFDELKDLTLDEIGRRHGVSAERVRQLAERWGRLSRRSERTTEMVSLGELVREALEGATSLQQVADRTGLSVGQIRRVAEVALDLNPAEITEANRLAERDRELAEQSERLRMAIEMAGLTHKQIAQALGIQPSRITNMANGRIPGIETFRQPLAKVLGVTPAWLLEGSNPPAWLRPGMSEHGILAERAAVCLRIKQAIDSLQPHLDIAQVAARAGLSAQALAMIAANRSSPRRHIAALADALLVPERWLRTGTPEPEWTTRVTRARALA